MPVVIDTQEAEIRRIDLPGQIVCKMLSKKKKKKTISYKKDWWNGSRGRP
jgi:hypothetical protein